MYDKLIVQISSILIFAILRLLRNVLIAVCITSLQMYIPVCVSLRMLVKELKRVGYRTIRKVKCVTSNKCTQLVFDK